MNKEQFVERETIYNFKHGVVSVYESNCPCRGVLFHFERHVISIMLSGDKSIISSGEEIEFSSGVLLIPENNVIQEINIENASFMNPTKCLVLDICPLFLEKFYLEYQGSCEVDDKLVVEKVEKKAYYRSNDKETIDALNRLYENIKKTSSLSDDVINTLILKELLVRVFRTDAKQLMLANIDNSIKNKTIEKTITYIKQNLNNNITINDLTIISGFGKTKFFKLFKDSVGVTPVKYVMNERINQSKQLMKTSNNLQSIAFKCGFNTYEHFYKSFKEIVGETPTIYKKKIIK